jgi:transcriptional regulator with XRE-family HTH domain
MTWAGNDVGRVVEDGRMVARESFSPRGARRRRPELGRFLKARRARLRPEDLGMPPGERRRTPGLRREEVALDAGVGLTWYTWLEQGRPINASFQVLDAIARTLRMDKAERQHFYRLADATPTRTDGSEPVVPDSLKQIVRALDPLPAALLNARFDVLWSNDALKDLFHGWHTLPCVHNNLLWCCLTEATARERFLNYDQEVPFLVARLRSSYAHHLDDPEWNADIERLADLSAEFAEMWARHEVAEPEVRVRRLRHPVAGELTFSATELDVTAVRDLRITVYTPADAKTWARLPATRREDTGQTARDATPRSGVAALLRDVPHGGGVGE